MVVPGVHAPLPGVPLVSPSVLRGARVLLAEGLAPGTSEETDPADRVMQPRPTIVSGAPMLIAAWAAGLDLGRLRSALLAHAGCLSRSESRSRQLSDFRHDPFADPQLTAQVAMAIPKPEMADWILETPCARADAPARDDVLHLVAAAHHLPTVWLDTPYGKARAERAVPPAFWRAVIASILAGHPAAEEDPGFLGLVNRGAFDQLAGYHIAGVSVALAEAAHQALVVERNRDWLPVLVRELRRGRAVVLAGAGHFGGEGGLIALLRAAGFTVVPAALPEFAPGHPVTFEDLQ
ncbi:hypothetical protein AA12717_3072 [Gluconacetobacter sacchari DSM 12717]|nr:hypothetical protein AA12717_3072 [Gluconacetobacter sacchari DSM 12717]